MKKLFLATIACAACLLLYLGVAVAENTWEIVGSIEGLIDCTGITYDGTWIWATEQHRNGSTTSLYRIDPATVTIMETIYIGLGDCCIQGLAWDGEYIWISSNGYNIYRFDPVSTVLQYVCSRPTNPQVTGFGSIGATLYATGWNASTVVPDDLIRLDPADCGYEIITNLATTGTHGMAWDGAGFLVCGRMPGQGQFEKTLRKYSIAGDLELTYEPFDFNAYDLGWDGEYLWVCDYGSQSNMDGRILKIRLGETVEACIDFDPNTLNTKSWGQWVTCYIELPEGYDVGDIDIASIMLNDLVPAEMSPTAIDDYDGDGCPDLMVKFGHQAIISILTTGESVPVTITGDVGADMFTGTDFINVIAPPVEPSDDEDGIPAVEMVALDVYPNPFNPSVQIMYGVPKRGRVLVQILDVTGQLIRTLEDGEKPHGEYRTEWHGTNETGINVSSGVYFCRLSVGSDIVTRKLMLIR